MSVIWMVYENRKFHSTQKKCICNSHSASKPFPCPTCHRCFVSSATRARHTARVHADPASCPHACSQCPRRYKSCKDLQRHTKA
ncbi:hypothetical protein MSG28_015470 [Choristoneura fumiferana]|uniref:Uncharacterized protein n=1 Tax=Choristoneura fumiferana TaxID=7141 RepID=A0ACC0KAP8_CHOFU|nr:hypothetical protein MSG28_015470 [Choristoneura fumiferana]